jgi:RNA recognition motif-containing protein
MCRNVMQSVKLAELRELFGKYGRVNDVYQPLNRARGSVHNYAFIKFDEREAAERAVEALDNTMLHDGCVVAPAAPPPPPNTPLHRHSHTHTQTRSPRAAA